MRTKVFAALAMLWPSFALGADCPYAPAKDAMDPDEYADRCAEWAATMADMDDSLKRQKRGEAPPGGYMCKDVFKHCRGTWNKKSYEMWGSPDFWARTDKLSGKSWQQINWTQDSRHGRDPQFGIQCNTHGALVAFASFGGYMSDKTAKLALRIGEVVFSDLGAYPSADGVSYTVSDENQVRQIVLALRAASEDQEIITRGWDYNGVPSTLEFKVGAAAEALKWLPCLNY